MKRILYALILLFVFAQPAFCFDGAMSSGELTSSQQVVTGNVYITAVTVITDGSNNATVTLYDNTAASGKVVAEFVIAGGDNQGGRVWSFPVLCTAGIYAAISGTGASCIVEYTTR